MIDLNTIREVVDVSLHIYRTGLVSGIGGNVSARRGDRVFITPTMVPLGEVSLRNVVVVDLNGRVLRGGRPSSELELHLEVYRARPDVGGIVHTHSPYARAFSIAGVQIEKMEGFRGLGRGYIPMVPYHPPGSRELAAECGRVMADEDAAILEDHGVVCAGESLRDALLLAEFVEESARTQFISGVLESMKK
ncbi:class II aldolase/adducin family protein [Methanothermobacter thermautotrophicus]|uniref:Class II aldolase/adducin family protein n=1 Tax=Methanothermobacter thermautotrophicus TaxID=145262 RepID=A0A842YQR2_METTF|nr:class II aldolase/adducin family protein [Methanothermobacter thermautotrophicus]MBE2900015.1 class II aldolase/adducin family protein [Methanothermobacter thermautotrophicus]